MSDLFRAFLFFVAQVQSLAHTHVSSGSSPIVGPFFLAKLLAFSFSPGVYKIYAPCYKRSLMARAFLSFVAQVQSLAHTHVGSGSNPIVGPFFLAKLLAFAFFSVSDRIYGIFFLCSAQSFSLVHRTPNGSTPFKVCHVRHKDFLSS